MRVPDRLAERSERSALVALAAWVLLGCLVLGAPLGLAYLIGWPLAGLQLPHGLPHDPWTGHTLVRCGMLAAWFLWAQFSACVIVEIRSALSGIEIPTRIPGAALSRGVARAIVAVAISTSVAGTVVPTASARPVAVAAAGVSPNLNVAAASGSVGLNGGFSGVRAQPMSFMPSVPPARAADTADTGGTSPPVSTVSFTAASFTDASLTTGPAAGSPAQAAGLTALKYYVVQPPGGRHHDSLWDIAQRYLGDGRRYREIFALNEGRLQPDGTELQHASLIRPGWVLVMPADANGPGLSEELPTSSQAQSPPTAASPPSSTPAQGAPTQTAPSHTTTATPSAPSSASSPNSSGINGTGSNTYAMPGASHTAQSPSSTIPHPVASRPAVPQHEPVGAHAAEGSVLHSIADVLPYVALIGSPVLAAALLGGLTAAARRRRRDQPDAAFAVPPDPAVAEVERTIRAAASCDTVDFVDRAMRALRVACETAGRVPPELRNARTDPDAMYLTLDPADMQAPAPFTALVAGQQWRYARDTPAPVSGPGGSEPGSVTGRRQAVPYPLLLAVGTVGEEQVLVNLEASAGRCTAVTGPIRQRRAVLAAAAATLAAAPWADQIRIEAVGLPAELALLAPERLRVHPDLGAALTALEHDAAATGPHLVRLLIAESVGPEETVRLRNLTAGADGSTTALVGTDHPWPDFTVLSVDPVGRLRVPGILGDMAAARLPDALAAALGALFRAAAAPRYAPAYRPSDAPLAGGIELLDRPAGVRACILGSVELTGVGPADAARGPLFTEALVLLLFHRAGLPAPVFARALWPRGITPAARDRMLRDMRDWLGEGADGPRLLIAADGLVNLTDDVRADWDEFQAAYRDAGRLSDGTGFTGYSGIGSGSNGSNGHGGNGHSAHGHGGNGNGASGNGNGGNGRPDSGDGYLQAADAALARGLELVRGELLADRPPGRYSWLGFGTQETEVPAVIADAAFRLATRRLLRGDALGAQWAAEQGLLGAPDDERLVQIKIRGIAAQGDQERLHTVIADLKVRAWQRYGETELHPSTGAVVSELIEGLRG
jgi:hypothetical protein